MIGNIYLFMMVLLANAGVFSADAKAASFEGKAFSGKYLMETGIELNLNGEYAGKVLMIEAR